MPLTLVYIKQNLKSPNLLNENVMLYIIICRFKSTRISANRFYTWSSSKIDSERKWQGNSCGPYGIRRKAWWCNCSCEQYSAKHQIQCCIPYCHFERHCGPSEVKPYLWNFISPLFNRGWFFTCSSALEKDIFNNRDSYLFCAL